jgi:fucose 4-O-acetylase-like acetyltransferase
VGEDRRYYGLDALRGGMMLLGIVLHSATLYLAAPPPHLPVATDPNQSLAMDVISAFIHAFRMPTFFVLAGFFTALLVEKRGVTGMYRNRLARIGAPFAAGMFTILPLTLLFLLDFAISVRYGKHNLLPEMGDVLRLERESRDLGIPQGLPVMHLWFLLYLGYFYLLVPFCRMLVRWSLPFEGPLGRFLSSPYSLPVFSLWTAATLWPYPGAMVLGDFIFLGMSPPAFFYYGTFFVIGYIYHHYRASTAKLVDYLPACAALACVLFPLSLYATHTEYTSPTAGMGDHLFTVVLHGFCTWTLVWAFVGVALRYFDRPTPWALYASQSAYWVYLLHLPVVGLVGWLLVPVDVNALVKFTIVGAVTTVVCFVSYHYGVQNTWLGSFLHGRRFQLDWPWRGGRAI